MAFKHRDWLVCESLLADQTYLLHTARPAFLGRVYDEKDAPIVGGVSLSLPNGQVLAELIWYDEPVTSTNRLASIAAEAGKALDLYDGILEVDRRKLLAEAIEAAGLSIPAAARRAGVNQQTIYNYLAHRSDMTVELYHRILQSLP